MKVSRKLSLLIALVLVLALAAPAVAQPPEWVKAKKELKVKEKMQARFRDVDSHWAAQAVERMTVKGYIKGFEDKTFRPKSSVTNEQVLTMLVRALYPDAEVDIDGDVSFRMKHWKQISSPWALQYLQLALDEGLTTAEELQRLIPKKAAKRIDVARYIARALINEDVDAKQLELDFIDMDKVEGSDVNLLQIVVAAGIFKGNPDGSFQPNKAVSRAEMALLLERLDAEIENELDQVEVRGRLEEVDEDDYRLTVTVKGDSVTYQVYETASIFRNSERAELSDLEEGDSVVLLLNEDEEVVFIGAREVAETETITGVVYAVYGGDDAWIKVEVDDEVEKYFLAEEFDIEVYGEEAELEGYQWEDDWNKRGKGKHK